MFLTTLVSKVWREAKNGDLFKERLKIETIFQERVYWYANIYVPHCYLVETISANFIMTKTFQTNTMLRAGLSS